VPRHGQIVLGTDPGTAAAQASASAPDYACNSLKRMEAPPGFEPGMEVLQTGQRRENGPELEGSGPFLRRHLGWRWVADGAGLTVFGHTLGHSRSDGERLNTVSSPLASK